jgi:hypothetical protein
MQDVGSRENRKSFEEGLNPKVQYRLSKPLDTVSVLEIALHADGFRFHNPEFIGVPKLFDRQWIHLDGESA